MSEDSYNKDNDEIHKSKLIKVDNQQLHIRLITHKKYETKVEINKHRLDELGEPIGYNQKRYNIKELDALIETLINYRELLKVHITNDSYNISNILRAARLKTIRATRLNKEVEK